MSETTQSQLQDPPADAADLLVNLILTCLAPMFLTTAGGDINHARIAAAHTLESYRAETRFDLIAIAQIIAFGLAALGSLSLSMTDGLSIPMILRLRGNAQSSSRASEQIRRALKQNRQPEPAPYPDAAEPEFDEAEVIAATAMTQQRATTATAQQRATTATIQHAATTQQRAAAAQAQIHRPRVTSTQPAASLEPAPQPPASTPMPVAPSSTTIPLRSEPAHGQTIWANAFAQVAAEIAAEIPGLPPRQRRDATIRVAALNSSANELLCGNTETRLRPGDRPWG